MTQIITDISLGIQVKSYIPLHINKPCKELLRIHMSEIRNKHVGPISFTCHAIQISYLTYILLITDCLL